MERRQVYSGPVDEYSAGQVPSFICLFFASAPALLSQTTLIVVIRSHDDVDNNGAIRMYKGTIRL